MHFIDGFPFAVKVPEPQKPALTRNLCFAFDATLPPEKVYVYKRTEESDEFR